MELFHLYDECKCIDLEEQEGQGISFVCMQGDFLWCEGQSDHTVNSAHAGEAGGKRGDGSSGLGNKLYEKDSSRGEKTNQNQILVVSVCALLGAALLTMVVRVVSRRQLRASRGFYPTTPNSMDATYRDDNNEEKQGRENNEMEDDKEGVSSSQNQQQPKSNTSQVELATLS